MPRLTLVMNQQERLVLEEMARRELRNPRECIRVLIRQAAVHRGLLTMEDAGIEISREEVSHERTAVQ